MMTKTYYRCLMLVVYLLFGGHNAFTQENRISQETPSVGIKNNLLYDAAATINLGVEFKMSRKWTVDLPVSYNPWTFNANKKWQHVLVQPEVRRWFCESFSGHFLGLHGHYAYYNMGNINLGISRMPYDVPLENLKTHRYSGWLAGAGLTYGYQCYLSKRFNLEFSLGVGWAYLHYNKYRCAKCGDKIGEGHKNYFGPTKAAVTVVYLLK